MKPNVVPMDEELRRAVEFADWFRDMLVNNNVAVVSLRGIDVNCEPFSFDIVPRPGNDVLRYMLIGLLEETKAMLIPE